jgi:hypothetical protein
MCIMKLADKMQRANHHALPIQLQNETREVTAEHTGHIRTALRQRNARTAAGGSKSTHTQDIMPYTFHFPSV